MQITINSKKINIPASLEVEDLNEEGLEFNPGQVQVVVRAGAYGFAYQTTPTVDAGGVSSKLAINSESGAYDQILELLQEHDALDAEEDEDDQINAAGLAIGKALGVQDAYDTYMSSIGDWESSDGLDANSETFVKA